MSRRQQRATAGGLLLIYDFAWDGADRLRQVKQGGTTLFSATYNGAGLRVFKSDAWTGAHDYSWGPGGLVFDSAGSTVYTPGLAERKNGLNRFDHSDWHGSTRWQSDGANGTNVPTGLDFDAFGNRTLPGGAEFHPTDFQYAGNKNTMSRRLFALIGDMTGALRTKHFVGLPPELSNGVDGCVALPWPRVLILEVKPEEGTFLYRYAPNGECAGDTWHPDVEEAKHQAVFEYGDALGCWREIPDEVWDEVEYALAHLLLHRIHW
jgi:hypothetical protein